MITEAWGPLQEHTVNYIRNTMFLPLIVRSLSSSSSPSWYPLLNQQLLVFLYKYLGTTKETTLHLIYSSSVWMFIFASLFIKLNQFICKSVSRSNKSLQKYFTSFETALCGMQVEGNTICGIQVVEITICGIQVGGNHNDAFILCNILKDNPVWERDLVAPLFA